MARSTKSYEERLLQLEKREQESLEKAKQYAAQKRELKKRQKDVETKKRTHRLCQIGGAVESVIGSAIEEEDIPKLVEWAAMCAAASCTLSTTFTARM